MSRKIIYLIFVMVSCSQAKTQGQTEVTLQVETEIVHADLNNTPIDLHKSIVYWKGTKITGKHEGTVKFKQGFLTFSDDKLIGGKLIVDMNTIDISDIPKHETVPRRNLLNHVIEEFAIESFSAASFTFDQVSHLTGTKMKVAGQMEIKGVNRPIEIEAVQEENAFVSEFSFNRFDWGIGEDGSWFEKKLVDEMVELKIQLHPAVSRINQASRDE